MRRAILVKLKPVMMILITVILSATVLKTAIYAEDAETKTIVEYHWELTDVRHYGPGDDSDEIDGVRISGKWNSDGDAILTCKEGISKTTYTVSAPKLDKSYAGSVYPFSTELNISRRSTVGGPIGDVSISLMNLPLVDGEEEQGFPERPKRVYFYKDQERNRFNMSDRLSSISLKDVLPENVGANCNITMRMKRMGFFYDTDADPTTEGLKSAVVLEVLDGKKNGLLMRTVYEYTRVIDKIETVTIEPELPKEEVENNDSIPDSDPGYYEIDGPVQEMGPGWLTIYDGLGVMVSSSSAIFVGILALVIVSTVIVFGALKR